MSGFATRRFGPPTALNKPVHPFRARLDHGVTLFVAPAAKEAEPEVTLKPILDRGVDASI